ncbi:uncharacterized protein LOC103574300 [Microplitis demolitor]|uniref:uncharacterized protein LOC103574300 n=1 Tax=Microplitis demolitor TaxID=69319 RepID=UPI00235B677E|nr:uncharacterized protein LOC103574300 [Microplitis demolitor]
MNYQLNVPISETELQTVMEKQNRLRARLLAFREQESSRCRTLPPMIDFNCLNGNDSNHAYVERELPVLATSGARIVRTAQGLLRAENSNSRVGELIVLATTENEIMPIRASGVFDIEHMGAGENEPKCLRPLQVSLNCPPCVRKQSTDSDSTSTELCDEHEHSSDSEDQASLSDNPGAELIDENHPQLSDNPTYCPLTYCQPSMKKDLLVDKVNECKNKIWLKAGSSSPIIKITDNIRSLSAENNLIDINTCIDKDNLRNENKNEILKLQDENFIICSKSSVPKNIEDQFSNCYHSSSIKTSFRENDNNTSIDEHYDSSKDPSISNTLVRNDVLNENSTILVNNELSSDSISSGIFIPKTLSKDDALIFDSYSSSNIKKNMKDTVDDSNYDAINFLPMSTTIVDRKILLTDLELLTNKITESNEQISYDVLQKKHTFIHNQAEPEMIPNHFCCLNVDEGRQQDNHKLNKIICNSKESAKSDSNGFCIIKNSQSQKKQNCYHSKHYSVNGNLNTSQLVLTQSDNVHSRLTFDSSLLENSSRLKIDGSTSSISFNLDSSDHEVDVSPIKSRTECLRNSLDNHMVAENSEKLVSSILHSSKKGTTIECAAHYRHQNDFCKFPCKPSRIISPFFPIIGPIKKSPSPNHANEMETNNNQFKNILPTRATSLKESSQSNFYDRCKLLSFPQTIDTKPIHDFRTECFDFANTSATQFVDLLYCEKPKNEELNILDLDMNSLNFKRLTDNVSISQMKSDDQSKYLNNSKEIDYSSPQLCESKLFEQNYRHCNKNLKRCEYSIHDSACQFFEGEVKIPDSHVLTNPSKSYVVEPKIQMDEKSDSFLIKYTKNKDIEDSNGEIECKLGVWTKVQPRKKGQNGRRDSCDRALKIIQENSAILHKILSCQAKKCLPDLEEISQEITISPINEEISKIFSPILEHIGLNEYEINEELATINFNDFNSMSGIGQSEYDKKINIEHSQLSVNDDKELCHFDEDRISITDFLYSREPLIHNKMNKERSRMIDKCKGKSPNNLCLFNEFSKKSPSDIEALNICSCSSNKFSQEFSENLEHKRDHHFFKDTCSHAEKYPDYIDKLKEYSTESICPRAEDLFFNSDIDIYRELEKLDKMSPHDSMQSNFPNMIQESVSPLSPIIESSARSKKEIAVKHHDEFERTSNYISPDVSHTSHEHDNVQDDILLKSSYQFRVCYEDEISPSRKICTDIFSLNSCKTDQEAVHLSKSPNLYDDHLNVDKQNTSVASMISPKKNIDVDKKFDSQLLILQTPYHKLSADYEYSREDDCTPNSMDTL